MEATERLSVEEAGAPTVLAAHHLHRYELAARLCAGQRVLDLGCGVGYGSNMLAAAGAAAVEGVDVDEGAIEEARRAFGSDTVSFTTADAVERLRRLDAADVDVIVAFEALEHIDRLEAALELLAELAGQGVRLILSVPNSRAFDEQNEYHLTDFGYDEARAAFARFGKPRMLYQHLAEGSVLSDGEGPLEGVAAGLAEADPEYANTFIALVGFPDDAVTGVTAHLTILAKPSLNRYMIELEAANEELRRTNMRLTRGWLGKSDAAAASAVARYEADIRDLRERLELAVTTRDARIEELEIVARRNDEMYQRELAWRDATRYHAVDWIRDRLVAVPGLRSLARWSWRVVQAVRGR